MESAAPAAGEADGRRDELLCVGEREARARGPLLGLHDEGRVLRERGGGLPQELRLVPGRQQVEHVDDRHRVAARDGLVDDVALFETDRFAVVHRGARDGDLALVHVDAEDPPPGGGFHEQVGEEPVATAEVDDEPMPRDVPVHEREVRQEGPSVHVGARDEWRVAIAADRAIERRRRGATGHP